VVGATPMLAAGIAFPTRSAIVVASLSSLPLNWTRLVLQVRASRKGAGLRRSGQRG
jgi:hypothetical protein